MEYWTNFVFTLSVDEILRGEGMDPLSIHAKRPALVKAAEYALRVGMPKIDPVAIINEKKVIEHHHERILLDSGTALTGSLFVQFLAGAERVVAAVCTIGSGLEGLASSEMDKNPLLALALDGLGNACVESVAQQVCRRISEQAKASGLESGTPLSPGEPDWPVDIGQPQIFSLLDNSQTGILLTEGSMMIPKKSISFLIGLGLKMEQADLCSLCSMRERCRYHRA
jgi:hypothetical protein